MLVDYLLKTKDSRPPSSQTYRGHYWGIGDDSDKLRNLYFAYNYTVKWEDVPLGSYYRVGDGYITKTYILIGEYCIYCDTINLNLPPDRFYIKGAISSNDFTVVPLNASKLLQDTLKRNPRYVCVADVSETSYKNHININSDGMFVDFVRSDETRTDLCYYASTAYDPIIPLYPGYEIEPILNNATPSLELIITSYKLN